MWFSFLHTFVCLLHFIIAVAKRSLLNLAPDSTAAATGGSSTKPVTAEEIIAALPPTGISIGDMLKLFPGRVKGGKEKDRFIRMVKENSSYNADDKKLRPKA